MSSNSRGSLSDLLPVLPDLTRLPPRESTLDGRWTRKPFGLSRIQPICLSVSRHLRYMSMLFLNILTLPPPTQSADNMFHSFTVLCENENFLISSLHCFFANATPCPLVLRSSLTEEQIILSTFLYPFKILNISIWFPLSLLVSYVVKPRSFRRIS